LLDPIPKEKMEAFSKSMKEAAWIPFDEAKKSWNLTYVKAAKSDELIDLLNMIQHELLQRKKTD
jgi:hypothetical protein